MSAPTPLSIITSVPIVGWYRADNVDLNGSNVAGFPELSGSGYHGAQGDPAKQPAWVASSANFNGRPTMTFDGTDDTLDFVGLPFPAPGTTNRQIRVICRLIAWTINRALWGGGITGIQQLFCSTASPTVAFYNGGASILGSFTAGNTRRVRTLATNAATCRLLIGSVSTGSATNGNISGSDWHLGSNGTAGSYCNLEVAEVLITDGGISAAEETALQAYETPMYGAGIYT